MNSEGIQVASAVAQAASEGGHGTPADVLFNIGPVDVLGGGSNVLFSIGPLEVTSVTTTMWGIMAILILLSWLGTRKLSKVPGKVQNIMEIAVDGVYNFFGDIFGTKERATKYMPFLGTMFLFIIIANYSGLLPSAGHLPGLAAPTASLGVTAALAIIVFFATQYYGFKANGMHYLGHFVKPMAFLLPLLVLEEFIHPLSLSLRLYGNIFGEEMVTTQLFSMAPFLVPLVMQVLSLLFCAIQALVFTLLSSIYIEASSGSGH